MGGEVRMTAPALTLTFRDCGFGGREVACLGDYVIGAVEAGALPGMRATWSFFPPAQGRFVRQPCNTVNDGRDQVRVALGFMLRDMRIEYRELRVVIEPMPRKLRLAFSRRAARPG
jgi:hypothetical protein